MPTDIAVGFDFDHTLGLDNKLERTTALDMLADFAKAKGLTYDLAAADAAIDAVLATYRSGKQSVEIAIGGFFERFAPAGSATLDEAQRFRDIVVERAPAYVTPVDGALAMLQSLDSAGIRYAILTNGWSPLQEEKARIISFNGSVYVSERIGALKPSARAFGMLVEHFELPAERIYYVGDDPETDCAGAAAAGLVPVWFDWESRSYGAGLAAPAHTIHALADLPGLLQGP